MLSDEKTYKKLKKDPSENTKKQLIRKLTSLKEQKKITDSQYKYLYPTTNNIPRLYCTPKIHKQDNPLRPIVDYSGSANYKLGRDLADLLNPLMGQTEHHLQNSKDLKKKLENVQLKEGEILISHDIVSLFTNVPIQESLNVIRSRLEQDDTLKDRTLLSVDDILDLLEFVCDSTYFQFEGQLYKQCFGTAMGSPVSPIIANLFMEHQEQLALQNCPPEMKPSFWYRYVDDIGESVKEDQADNLTAYLNTVDKTGNIKYTSEHEQDRTLPMLDVKMTVTNTNRIKTTVYRKKTHTDQYLNFESHHPLHQKIGVVRSLLDRKEAIVSTEEDKKKEDDHITQALKKNNYPMWAIKKAKTLQSQEKHTQEKKKKDKTPKKDGNRLVTIPYQQGTSERLSNAFKKRGYATAMKPHTTIRSLVVHPKDKLKPDQKAGVVYQIPCQQCDKSYIGETGRMLKERISEHERDVRLNSKSQFTRSQRKQSEGELNKSAITDHCNRQNHTIAWDKIKVVNQESNTTARRIKEAITIKRTNNMNRDEGTHYLSPIYHSIITQSGSQHKAGVKPNQA